MRLVTDQLVNQAWATRCRLNAAIEGTIGTGDKNRINRLCKAHLRAYDRYQRREALNNPDNIQE